MRNPLAKPRTAGQWLLGSVCWAVACVGGWALVSNWVLKVPYDQKTPDEPLVFASFLVAYGLMWWKALPGLKATEKDASWLEMLAFVWQVGLVAFQMLWLGIILLILFAPSFYNLENLSN